MKLVVKGVNLTVSASLRAYVGEKLVKPFSKLLSRQPAFEAASLELELIHSTRHHKKGNVWEAAVNFRLPGKTFSQRVSAEEIHAAIDELETLLRREIIQYKERSRSRAFRGARQAKRHYRFDRSARLSRRNRTREEGL